MRYKENNNETKNKIRIDKHVFELSKLLCIMFDDDGLLFRGFLYTGIIVYAINKLLHVELHTNNDDIIK